MKRKCETALQHDQAKMSKLEDAFPGFDSRPTPSTSTLPPPSSLPPTISKLQKVFQQRTFCRQLSALCTQKEALERRIIQLVGVKLVSYAKSEEVKITEEMVKEGLNLSAINIDIDIPDWVDSLNDVVEYGDHLPIVETSREWTKELKEIDMSQLPSEFCAQMEAIAKYAASTLNQIVSGLSGPDLVQLLEIQSSKWSDLFAMWGLEQTKLDRALHTLYPDLNEAVLHFYKYKKPLQLKEVTADEAKEIDRQMEAEKEKLDAVTVSIPEAEEFEPDDEEESEPDEEDDEDEIETESGDEDQSSSDELSLPESLGESGSDTSDFEDGEESDD